MLFTIPMPELQTSNVTIKNNYVPIHTVMVLKRMIIQVMVLSRQECLETAGNKFENIGSL